MRTTTTLVLLSSFVALALAAAPATAQDRPPAAPAPTASMPMDCGSGAVKRHDHAAERNAPPLKSVPCAPQAPASSAESKAKPAHDHAKFNKNQ